MQPPTIEWAKGCSRMSLKQVNRTKIVKEITMYHQQMGQIQAHLKSLLNRDQASPDIVGTK